jgi:hypothetical protein
MRGLVWTVCGLLVAGLGGCSSLSYHSDYDRQTDFSVYQSFTWIGGSYEPLEPGAGDSGFFEQLVRSAVEEELGGMGFTVRSQGEADMLIAYHASAKETIDSNPQDYGYAYGRWAYSDVSVQAYREGTLIIDLIDAGTKELVWRGWATGTIQENLSSEERNKRVRDAIAKIMDQYPPRH